MTARLPDDAEAHFQRCMAVWVDWMHAKDSHRLGLPSRDSVSGRSLTNYSVAEDDADVVYDMLDPKLAAIVNACVESLMPTERHAILMCYGFSRVWPYLNLDFDRQVELGLVTLRRLVARRC